MSNQDLDGAGDAFYRQEALSRCYGDKGAGPDDEFPETGLRVLPPATPIPGEPELQALHVRVIALEDLVIALLARTASRLARSRRALLPRPGFTRHPLAIRAAARMTDLIDRAARFGKRRPSQRLLATTEARPNGGDELQAVGSFRA